VNGIGTPISLDDAKKIRLFRHYAEVLIDLDLYKRMHESILVQREGFAFYVPVIFLKMPDF